MLSRSAKQGLIDEFSDTFKSNPSVMVIEYKGLTVKEMEGLRQDLQDADTEFKVVKNTLLKLASKDTDIEKINDLFIGPTAVAICNNDPTSAAKVFVKTAKDLPSLVIKGGIVDGNIVDDNQIAELSKLLSRVEMISQFMGLLKAPISNVVGALVQMQSKLLYALTALKEAKENEPGTGVESAGMKEAPAEETKGKEEASEEQQGQETPETTEEAKAEEHEEVQEAKATPEEDSPEGVQEEAPEAEPQSETEGSGEKEES